MSKVVLIYSGCPSSRLLLELARKMGYYIFAVIFDYEEEDEKVRKAIEIMNKYSIPFKVIEVSGLENLECRTKKLWMLGIAISIADEIDADEVWISSCNISETFIKKYNEIVDNVVVKAPLIGFDKYDIMKLLEGLEIPKEEYQMIKKKGEKVEFRKKNEGEWNWT